MDLLIIFIIGYLIGEFIKTVRRAEQPLLPQAIAALRADLQTGAPERGTQFDKHTGLCLRWEPEGDQSDVATTLQSERPPEVVVLMEDGKIIGYEYHLLPDLPTMGRRPPPAKNVKRTPPPKPPPPRMRVAMKPLPRR